VKSGAIESGSFFSPTPSSIKYQVFRIIMFEDITLAPPRHSTMRICNISLVPRCPTTEIERRHHNISTASADTVAAVVQPVSADVAPATQPDYELPTHLELYVPRSRRRQPDNQELCFRPRLVNIVVLMPNIKRRSNACSLKRVTDANCGSI